MGSQTGCNRSNKRPAHLAQILRWKCDGESIYRSGSHIIRGLDSVLPALPVASLAGDSYYNG